jgi:predicted ArsR family transcriptional regulator
MTRSVERVSRMTPFAVLAEPVRRRLFLFVASFAESVDREQAAKGVGVAPSVAAFHLDKLADAGVLTVEYRRPPGRTGPGAGRPAKRYRAVESEHSFTVPERHYEVAAAILARAVADADTESRSITDSLHTAARSFGRTIGAGSQSPGGHLPKGNLERVATVLAPYGYEPCITEGQLVLANCPFRALAEEFGEIICRMNLRLLKGVLKGAAAKGLAARTDPSVGSCCVTIECR